jgi:diphthine methyl ester synthase
MALYFIGIGLDDEKDITLKGLEAVKSCAHVYLESYTSKLNCPIENLEHLYGKNIILADRELVEKRAYEILEDAKAKDVAFLVIGDIFGATTHTDLMLRARKMNIDCVFIHNASIMNAIGVVGLELYKFGKTTSIPFSTKSFNPETAYDVIKDNKGVGLHTLVLLDLNPKENKFLTVNDGIKKLMEIEEKRNEGIITPDSMIIGCARIGGDFKIVSGTAKELLDVDFGKPLHCLIVPGKLHFIEEEALGLWKNR